VYDEPEFIVRNVWRLYGGWYDGNPAHLQPAPAASLARELATLAGGATRLADRSLALMEVGDLALACHLVELALHAAPDDAAVREMRRTVYTRRAELAQSTMARGIYTAAATEAAAPGHD
jgi:alkyl sulfatase BDS1-like metallo-beta-lactamase superfamily hydrolase